MNHEGSTSRGGWATEDRWCVEDKLSKQDDCRTHEPKDERAVAAMPLGGEGQRAAPANGQQHRLDPPRPVAIEQHARGQLRRCEREEVRAREQAERRSADAEIC